MITFNSEGHPIVPNVLWDWRAALEREKDVNMPGTGHNLRNYWVRGPGAAKIGWGTDGSFARCVSNLGKYVKDPEGLCAEYHKAATGEWPAEKGVESVSESESFLFRKDQKRGPDGRWIDEGAADQDAQEGDRGPTGKKLVKRKGRWVEVDENGNVYPDPWNFPGERFPGTAGETQAFADKEPYGDVQYADPGYQEDGTKRYPIDTEEHIRAAWSYINQAKNAAKYSAADLKKVKARIRAAMKRIGADVSEADGTVTSSATLPWRIERREGKFAIVADSNDETVQSFTDRSDAVTLLRKLHAQRLAVSGETVTAAAAKNAAKAGEVAKQIAVIEAGANQPPNVAPWAGVLTVEGIESGDGRMFGANGLSWDEPPLPLMWQKETSHGGSTDKSVRVGSIHKIFREPDASGRADVFLIKGEGTLDLDNPDGAEVFRRMKNGDMRGNSVDVDSIKNADVELVYPEATGESTESMLTQVFAQPELTVYRKGRIRATTLVEIPAFTEARLELLEDGTVTASDGCQECQVVVEDADGQRMAALTAASAVIEIPDLPPAEWFDEPTDVAMDGALTVTAEGRIYGFVAPAGVRHRSFSQRAQYVPLRNVDYDRFHGGQTLVAGGGRVSTGNITMDCGHATTALKLTGQQAAEHYDNTCSIVATARVGENEQGVWVAGALLPDVDAATVRRMMACRLSGDWRTHLDRAGWREFVAALLVPVPGFPMARNAASVEISEGALVASSVPVRMLIGDQPLALRARVQAAAQRIGRDNVSRRAAAVARVRAGRVAALTARVEQFHGKHDQSDHGNWVDKVKGLVGPKLTKKNAKVGDTGPSGGRLEKRPGGPGTWGEWVEVMPDGTVYPAPFDFPGERFPNT